MSRLVLVLARHTVAQARYDRLHLALPAYFLGCLALVPVASHLALGSGSRAALEVGMLLQWWITSAAGGWLGLRTVGLDLDRRTAAIVLSGPVDPATWLLGRAAGVGALLAALVVGLQIVWLPIASWRGLAPSADWLAFSLGLWLEAAIIAALTALLSTRSRPLVAAGAAASLWVAGHLAGEYSGLMSEWGTGSLSTVLFALIPDLDLLDFQSRIISGPALTATDVGLATAYATCWLVGLSALTVASVRTRDLT